MLIQFRYKNFKSFRDDTILDFSATKITEHSGRVVQIGNEKILPTAAIFGANASGKSNVIQAFRFMTTYVIDSFAFGGEGDDKKSKTKKLKQTPFLFDKESRDAESSFEVYFISSEEAGCKSYNYGFTLDQTGIVEEWLNVKSKTARSYKPVFYRNRYELDLSGLPAKSQEIIRMALETETLIVSLGAKLKISKLKCIRDWFYDTNFTNFGNPIENVFLSSLIPDGFADDKDVQKKVVDYFATFDSSIVGFNVEVIKGDDEDSRHIKIDALHEVIGSDEIASIPLEEESDGTLKMFALYPALQDTLESGGVLFVDELNARLHPLLVRGFLITFLNPETNPKHAQLVFTTHDSWQLSNNLLRRDEIWFTEKELSGVSTLYSLADFVDEDGAKIRKDESYEKNYLLGKYGAIPTLKYFDMFKGE
jgi:AAA15 family ATPase/GTPase